MKTLNSLLTPKLLNPLNFLNFLNFKLQTILIATVISVFEYLPWYWS